MITRVGFCPVCNQADRPKTNNSYIVFGARSNSFIGKTALRNAVRGFTPHIYEFNRLIDKVVYYSKTCCMCGCGAYKSKDEKLIYLDDEKSEECYTSLNNWNSLVMFKNTGFEI